MNEIGRGLGFDLKVIVVVALIVRLVVIVLAVLVLVRMAVAVMVKLLLLGVLVLVVMVMVLVLHRLLDLDRRLVDFLMDDLLLLDDRGLVVVMDALRVCVRVFVALLLDRNVNDDLLLFHVSAKRWQRSINKTVRVC